MPNQPESPIFFDPSRQRQRYYKVFVAITSLALSAAFIATLYNIFTKENLPVLNLAPPSPNYKGGPLPYQPNTKFQPAKVPAPNLAQNKNTNIAEHPAPKDYKPKVIGFYVNWDDTSLTSLKANYGSLDELIPEWLHLSDSNGNIIVDDQTRQNETIGFLNSSKPNLSISPLINNYNSDSESWNGDALAKMLSDANARANNENNILTFIQNNKFSGINIDYENIPEGSQPNFSLFVKELYAKLHPLNLELSVSVPIDDDSFDLKTLSENSDFLTLMAYDEHSADDQAGPVASQNWYTQALEKAVSQIPKGNFVLALGNYGYDWETGQTSGDTFTFQDAVRTAKESEGKITLDPSNLN